MTCIIEFILLMVISSANIYIEENQLIEDPEVEEVIEEVVEVELEPFVYEYSGNKSESCTYINIDSAKPVLLVGDSRTVGFHIGTKHDEFSYLARGSMGYKWLVDGTAKYKPCELIESYLEANPSGIVILNLGVNDPGNKEKYAQWVTEFVNNHPEASLHYLSVNPASRGDDLDSKVTEFNEYMKANIPETVVWLDSNSYLKEIGFSAWDGVHYEASTYKDILNFLLENLNL